MRVPPRLRGRRGGRKERERDAYNDELKRQGLIQIKGDTTLHYDGHVKLVSDKIIRPYIAGTPAFDSGRVLVTPTDYKISIRIDNAVNRQPKRAPRFSLRMTPDQKEARNIAVLSTPSLPIAPAASVQQLHYMDTISATLANMGLESDSIEIPYFDTHPLGHTGSGEHEHTCDSCLGPYVHSHDYSARHDTICPPCRLRMTFLVDAKGTFPEHSEELPAGLVPAETELYDLDEINNNDQLLPPKEDEDLGPSSGQHSINLSWRIQSDGKFAVKKMNFGQLMQHFEPDNSCFHLMMGRWNYQVRGAATGFRQPYFTYGDIRYLLDFDHKFASPAYWGKLVMTLNADRFYHLNLYSVKGKYYLQGRLPLLYSVPSPAIQCDKTFDHEIASCEHIRAVFPFCQISCQLPRANFYENIAPELDYRALDLPVREPDWVEKHKLCPTTMGDVCYSTMFREKTRRCPQHEQCGFCGWSRCCCSMFGRCDDDVMSPPLHVGEITNHFFFKNRPQHRLEGVHIEEDDYRELIAHFAAFPAVLKKNLDGELALWVKDLMAYCFPLEAKGSFVGKIKTCFDGLSSFASLTTTITSWVSSVRDALEGFKELLEDDWVRFACGLIVNIFCVVALFAYGYYGGRSKMVLFFLGLFTGALTIFSFASLKIALDTDRIAEDLNLLFTYVDTCPNGNIIHPEAVNAARENFSTNVIAKTRLSFEPLPDKLRAKLHKQIGDVRANRDALWQMHFDNARDKKMSLSESSAYANRQMNLTRSEDAIRKFEAESADSSDDEDLWGNAPDAPIVEAKMYRFQGAAYDVAQEGTYQQMFYQSGFARQQGRAQEEQLQTGLEVEAKGFPLAAANSIYSIFSSLFGFASHLKVSDINTFFQFGRNMKSVLGWIFNLFPECVSHWIATKCPDMSRWLSWQSGPWLSMETAFEEVEATLKDPSKEAVLYGRMLRVRAKELIRYHVAERWAVYAQKRLEKFETALQAAETAVFVVEEAQRPLAVVIAGAQGIGKTEAINNMASLLASVHKGAPTMHGVFKRGLGQYCEGLDKDTKFMVFPDIGAGSDETVDTHLGEWQAAADGNFAPNRAGLGEKGQVYPLLGIIQGTNYLHMPSRKTYGNLTAFHRRYDICAVAYIDKTFLCAAIIDKFSIVDDERRREVYNSSGIALFERWKPISTPEQRKQFAHLRFRLVPRDENSWRKVDRQEQPSAEASKTKEGMKDYPKWTRDLEFFANLNVETDAVPYHVMLKYVVWKFKQHHSTNKVRFNEGADYIREFMEAERIGVPQEMPVVDVPKDSKYYKMYLALGAMTTSAALIMGAYSVYQLFKRFAAENNEQDAKYVTRERSLKPRKRGPVDAKAAPFDEVTSPLEVLEERLHQQVVLVQMIRPDCEGLSGIQTGIMIDSTHVLTNTHCLLNTDGEIGYGQRLIVTYGDQDQDVVHEDRVEKLNFYAGDYRNDLVIVTLNKPIRGMKKIVGHFGTGKLNYEDIVGLYCYGETRFGTYTTDVDTCTYRQKGLKQLKPKGLIEFRMTMAHGDCGSPVVAKVNGNWKILAIANAGGETFQYGIKIDPSWLRDAVRADPGWDTVSVQEAAKGYPSVLSLTTDELDRPEGNYATVAEVLKPKCITMKTQLKKTPFYECDPSYPVRVRPAAQDFSIIRTQEAKHGNVRPAMNAELLDFGESCARALFPTVETKMQPYTFDEIAQIIERDKSLGFGLSGKRTDYMYEDEDGWHFKDELIEAVEELEADKRLPCPIITPCLKDETLKNEKVDLKKTRTFEISPFVYLVFGIRWCGPALDLLHADCTGASKVGMDVCSPDWDRTFRKHVKQRQGADNDWVDLDYAKMESRITWNEGKRYVSWLQSCVDDPDNNIGKYVYGMLDSLMLAGKMCYHRTQGNPSGMVGTVDINTFTNIMWIGACFKSVFGERATVRNFMQFINLALYGDDTVMSTFPTLDKEFNFFVLRDFLAPFGIEITPATKDSAPTSHVHQTVISFLKKKPLFSDQLNAFVPAVDWHTILDQLSWARDVTPDGLVQICNSALAFYFFRGTWKVNGQLPTDSPTFDEARNFMSAVGRIPIARLCTYEELLLRYASHRAPPKQIMSKLNNNNQPQAIAMSDVFEVEAKGNYQSSTQNFYGNNNRADQSPTSRQDISAEADVAAGTGGQSVGKGGSKSSSKLSAAADGVSAIADLFAKGVPASSMADSQKSTDGPSNKLPTPPGEIEMESIDDVLTLFDDMRVPVTQPSKLSTQEQHERAVSDAWGNNDTHWGDEFAVEAKGQPTISMIAHKVYNGLLTRATMDGVDEASNLTEHAATDQLPTSAEFGTSEDEMRHSFLRDKVCWLSKVDLPYNSIQGTQLLKIPMSPNQIVRGRVKINAALDISTLEYLSLLYYFFKGTIKLHFHIIGPREISGRLAICLGYNVFANSVDYRAAVRGPTVYFDYDAENRTITVDVPFQNGQVNILQCPVTLPTMPDDLRTSCGNVYVYMASKTSSSNAVYTKPPQLNVFISGGPDFEFHELQPLASLSYAAPTASNLGHNRMVDAKMLSGQTLHTDPTTRSQVAFKKTKRRDTTRPDSLAGFAGKFDIIGTYSITETTDTVVALNFPRDMMTQQSNYAYGASTYYRGDAVLRIKPIAAGWAAGLVLIAYAPFYDKTAPRPSNQRLTSLSYALLDLASDEAVELKIPFMSQEEQFYTGCPNVGSVWVVMLNQLQVPSTGVAAQDIILETAWENFTPIIPKQIATAFEILELEAKGAGDDATETTDKAALTSTEKMHVKAIAPLRGSSAEGGDESFLKHLTRLAPVSWHSLSFPANTTAEVQIVNPGQPLPGLAFHLSQLFAAFKGSLIYNIIIDGTDPSLYIVIAKKNISDGSKEWLTGPIETMQFQAPGYVSAGGTLYSNNNLAMSSSTGAKQVLKIRVHQQSQYRWSALFPKSGTIQPRGLPLLDQTAVFAYMRQVLAGNLQVFTELSLSEGARFAIFRGLPPIYLNPAVINKVVLNYTGEFLPLV
jgi:hypothetical protein